VIQKKSCGDCQILKPLEEFPPAAKRADGRGTYCRDCMQVRSRESYRRRKAAQGKSVREVVSAEGHRRCPDCGEVKPLDDFPRNKNSRDGRATYCKPCHNARSQQTRQRLSGGSRHYHLRKRYGMGAAEVEAIIEAQGGLCAICQEAPAQHVDHDHLFGGGVRGILCFNCNGGLGQFRDRVDIMRKAIDYLERTTWQRTMVAPGVYQLTSPPGQAAASPTSSLPPRPTSSRRG
jgi:hypothetical protein